MSLYIQGKILQISLRDYAKGLNIEASATFISTTKLLLIALANFYNDKTHQCNPSIKTLANCIEKSESQTTLHMNKLKELGLVKVNRNAKGGRFTPNYSICLPVSHPADEPANPPEDQTPHYVKSYPTPMAQRNLASYLQDATPSDHRTRILIEPLDESLFKSLINEKNIFAKNARLVEVAKKYGFQVQKNTPIHEVETWLLKLIKNSTPHGASHGNH
jgi:hypothetical protein